MLMKINGRNVVEMGNTVILDDGYYLRRNGDYLVFGKDGEAKVALKLGEGSKLRIAQFHRDYADIMGTGEAD